MATCKVVPKNPRTFKFIMTSGPAFALKLVSCSCCSFNTFRQCAQLSCLALLAVLNFPHDPYKSPQPGTFSKQIHEHIACKHIFSKHKGACVPRGGMEIVRMEITSPLFMSPMHTG